MNKERVMCLFLLKYKLTWNPHIPEPSCEKHLKFEVDTQFSQTYVGRDYWQRRHFQFRINDNGHFTKNEAQNCSINTGYLPQLIRSYEIIPGSKYLNLCG